jgi:hypothetical protein
MKSTDMKILDLLVQQSLQQYGEMFELLRTRAQQLDAHATEQINIFNAKYKTLQKEAMRTDQWLLEKLKAVEVTASPLAEMLARRKELQRKILVLLKETASKANIVKSLLANELQSIKRGRKALSGYKTNSDHQGRIVNRRS